MTVKHFGGKEQCPAADRHTPGVLYSCEFIILLSLLSGVFVRE